MIRKIYSTIIAIFLFLACMLSGLSAQSADDAYRTEIFRTTSSPYVNVNTSGGFVEVTGHDGNEVRVEMYAKRGRQYLSPSDSDLSNYEIDISQDGDNVTASAKGENNSWLGLFNSRNNISVSFRVFVPHASTVDGRTSGGSVSGENLSNGITLRTSGGSVTARNIEGYTDLRTSGGSITLENIHGETDARTSGGSIRAENVTGLANIRTSGGSIRLQNVAAKISARTSGGGIRAYLTDFSEDIDLRTSGGSIHIDIPATSHFNLDLTGQRVRTELTNFTGQSERRTVKGRMGDGGPLVKARTSGGSVELTYH